MRNTPNNSFPTHFRDFVKALNNNEVEYVLIGGYAMAVYGHYKVTGKMEILINATEDNSEKLLKASVEYGIPEDSLSKEMFLVTKMIGIGEPPLRIEILKKLDVVDFSYAFQRAELKLVDGLKINVVSLEDLILLKKAAEIGRSKARDSEDLQFLENLKAKKEK